ncbi:MAG: SDR family oxidoreductase, partial [Nanoarchaeota archaeon]|nr:SDR family oxidoreductase [Nanoarchaeota archaeon]
MNMKDSGIYKKIMNNKIALIFGIANKDSIAYSIAEKLNENGVEIIIAYHKMVEEIAKKSCEKITKKTFIECDVSKDE